jgi:hypothetical protein
MTTIINSSPLMCILGCGKTFFLVHLLHRIVDECSAQQRVLVCAPSNKAVCVAIERFRASSIPGSWKHFPVILVGVQDKIDNCSSTPFSSHSSPDAWEPSAGAESTTQDGREASLAVVVRDEMSRMWRRCSSSSPLSGTNGIKTTQNLDTKKIIAKIKPPLGSSATALPPMNVEANSCSMAQQPLGVVSPALLRAVGSVSDPETAPDVLVYTYSRRVGEAVQGMAAGYGSCVEALAFPAQGDLMALGLAALNGITDLYYDLMDTLSTVAPVLFRESVQARHDDICRGLERLSETIVESDTLAGKETMTAVWSDLKATFSDMSSLFLDGYTENQLMREVMRSAVVVCSTLSSAGCGAMKSAFAQHGFDMLVVDEAGQSLESELAIPFIYEPKQLILIGDPRQLPATVLSVEAQRLSMGMSTMQRLMYDCDSPFHLLSTQYRMHPDICQFPNDRFYSGELQTDGSVHQRPSILMDWSHRSSLGARAFHWMQPYTFVNISHTESSGGFGGKSKSNVGEATMIAR